MSTDTPTDDNLFEKALALHRKNLIPPAEKIYRDILARNPKHFDSLHMLGVLCRQKNDFRESISLLDLAISINPSVPAAHSNRAFILKDMQRLEESVTAFGLVLELDPLMFAARIGRAQILKESGRFSEALADFETVLQTAPENHDALVESAGLLIHFKRFSEAAILLKKALLQHPKHLRSLLQMSLVQLELRQLKQALTHVNAALALAPDSPAALNLRANICAKSQLHEEALRDFNRVYFLTPDNLDAQTNPVNFLCQLGRHEEALQMVDQLAQKHMGSIPLLLLKSKILQSLNRYTSAISVLDEILDLAPQNATAYKFKADILRNMQRLGEALKCYEAALRFQPAYPDAHYGQGIVLQAMKRHEEAIASYKEATLSDHYHMRLQGRAILCRMMICDWSDLEDQQRQLNEEILQGLHATTAFAALVSVYSPALLQKCAQLFVADVFPDRSKNNPLPKRTNSGKIRIGYFSSDFRNHPVSQLAIGFLEKHDHNQFEIIGINISSAPKDALTERVAAAMDQFIEVGSLMTEQIVAKCRDLQLDIAVDLNGLTFGGNTGIFARRVAPIQVNYLGYPGTSGAPYFDYIIADRIVVPEEHFAFYSEKVAHLPHSYLPNDPKKDISAHCPSRSEVGLPSKGFVFCCFNNCYKISPQIFAVWMRILARTPESVLWLSEMNQSAVINLKKAATQSGIDASRIIFATRTELLADHLARHALADLFLDTINYNAHTTASDALWTGLPVLTCMGESFAGRVAASLLNSLGVPELAVDSLESYENLAVAIATDPELYASLKKKILEKRKECPIYNPTEFARNMENLFQNMMKRHNQNHAPEHIV